jgi:hypothetical protein
VSEEADPVFGEVSRPLDLVNADADADGGWLLLA